MFVFTKPFFQKIPCFSGFFETLSARYSDNRSSPILGIAGASASGKSTLANALCNRYRETFVQLPLDRYYHDLSNLSMTERESVNFDSPDALDIPLFIKHLGILSTGKPVDTPVYDFSTHTRIGSETVEPAPILITDGILLLSLEDIRQIIDFAVFLTIDRETALTRKIRRDTRERGRTEDYARWQFETLVWPMFERYAEPSRMYADLVLDGASPPEELMAAMEKTIPFFPAPA